jgi:hypothetical protein
MEYVGRRKQTGVGGTTTTEGPVDPVKKLEAEAVIAKAAMDRGTTDAASLKKIAAEMGYELEGNATIEGPGPLNKFASGLGVSKADAPRLKGSFSLTPKSRTVTRTPGRAPAKAPTDDNDPAGIRPKRR